MTSFILIGSVIVILLIIYWFIQPIPITTDVTVVKHESFQPYMSVLKDNIFRSDAAFDDELSKPESEIYGNYI